MRRIIYHSIAAPHLDRAELFRLLYHARLANEARGISGVLLQADRRLLQVIEGPTWKLVAAFGAIRRDIRHQQVEVLDERTIEGATFPGWPMRYFDDHDIGRVMKELTAAAGGTLPKVIEQALSDFFVEAFVTAGGLSPCPLEAAQPSSPRPC